MSGLWPPLPLNNWCVQGHLLLLLLVVNYHSLLFVIIRETVITLLPVEYFIFTVIGGIALHIIMVYWQCLVSSAAQVFRLYLLAVPEG